MSVSGKGTSGKQLSKPIEDFSNRWSCSSECVTHHFPELARPLNDLTKKDKKFEWTEECQNTFDTLKKKFTEEPVLMMPDHSKPFQIESDASKVATGAVLTQLDSN